METTVTMSMVIRNDLLMLRFLSISTSWSWSQQGSALLTPNTMMRVTDQNDWQFVRLSLPTA
jgi:hypothetical protein